MRSRCPHQTECQLIVIIHRLISDELRGKLQELGVTVVQKELPLFLVIAEQLLQTSNDISCLGNGCLPIKAVRITVGSCPVVSVRIRHGGDELVAETLRHSWITHRNGIKRHRSLQQISVIQLEGHDGMVIPGGGVKVISRISPKRYHTEIAVPVHQVCPYLKIRLLAPVPFCLQKTRDKQTGDREVEIDAQLVGVHQPRVAGRLLASANLPLIGTGKPDGEILCTFEHVAVRDAERQTRSQQVVRFGGDIDFHVRLNRQGKVSAYLHVKPLGA